MSRNTAHARTNVTDATSSSDGVDHDHSSSSEAKLALFVERRLESADAVDAPARAVAATHRNRTNASSASPRARAIRARGFRPGDDIALATSTRALLLRRTRAAARSTQNMPLRPIDGAGAVKLKPDVGEKCELLNGQLARSDDTWHGSLSLGEDH
eukprot:30612-Pelagococcus_subviridis.AAC.13